MCVCVCFVGVVGVFVFYVMVFAVTVLCLDVNVCISCKYNIHMRVRSLFLRVCKIMSMKEGRKCFI